MLSLHRILCVIIFYFLGLVEARGSSYRMNYRAVRYGSYYSSTYFSYSGGKGYARYSRVYNDKKNLYPALYDYMFKWFKTENFKVYKNTPSGHISVCKNYEADENGTYLGIFTCPLPFVPESHAYCCGATNAQYCCKFWDIPLNFAAASLGALMGVMLVVLFIHVVIQLCINRRRIQREKEKFENLRRIGTIRRLGRQLSLRSIPLLRFFESVHAESNYREGRTFREDDEDSYTETSDTKSDIDTPNNNTKPDFEKNLKSNRTGDNTYTSDDQLNESVDDEASRSNLTNGASYPNITDVEHAHLGHGEKNKAFSDSDDSFNKTNDRLYLRTLKPLKKTPRVKFNSTYHPTVSQWYTEQNGRAAK